MKKINPIFVALIVSICLLSSTKVFSFNNNLIMNDAEFVNFDSFVKSAAIVFGVHSQLTQTEGVHIPEFDAIVAKTKQVLGKNGMSFAELAGSSDFVRVSGQARICAHSLYPEVEAIFEVSLPKYQTLSLDKYCKNLSFIQALETVKAFIL